MRREAMKTMEERINEQLNNLQVENEQLKTENETLLLQLATTQEALDFILMSM